MRRRLVMVSDASERVLITRPYDLVVLASGYEARAISLPSRILPHLSADVLVLGFEDMRNEGSRHDNDTFFSDRFGAKPVIVGEEPGVVSSLIEERLPDHGERARILVDISSMSRSWYGDIINWARFGRAPDDVEIDFVYIPGEYSGEHAPRVVSTTMSMAGFEGRADPGLETVAIMGLGYDAVTPAAIIEDLQPDLKFAFLPWNHDEAGLRKALELNASILSEVDGPVVVVPHLSVESSYRFIGEMVAPHSGIRNCVLVPLGPKTHILASLLVGARDEEITCLHVQGRSPAPVNVSAGKGISICTTRFTSVEARDTYSSFDISDR